MLMRVLSIDAMIVCAKDWPTRAVLGAEMVFHHIKKHWADAFTPHPRVCTSGAPTHPAVSASACLS
jgi:hypothetical protein